MKRDFSNFFGNSIADFYRCEIPDRDPDFVSFTGSAYWNYGNRIRRNINLKIIYKIEQYYTI